MFRYMSLIWDVTSPRQSHAVELLSRRLPVLSSQWRKVMDHGGLRIFCADARPGSLEPHLLANDSGVLLGALFERNSNPEDDTPSPKAVLGPQATASIVNSQGRSLITQYWGNYVAFVEVPALNTKWVIKDPTGNLPCFITQYQGVHIFFSCIADCRDLQLPLTMNRAYLRSRLADGGGSRKHTPLEEVTDLFRGECIEIDPTSQPAKITRRWYWTPLSFAGAEDLIEDSEYAARAMRATVRAATQSLANCHDSLLLRLSGGLDSSIINGCLKDAPATRVACYTHFNPRGRSDERPWARLAARHSGFEHLECAIVPEEVSLRAALQMPASVEPSLVLEFLQRTTVEKQLVTERDVTAVFTGDGGDSGFCSDSISHALAEYLRLHGVRLLAFRLAAQIAVLTQLSTWTVLVRSLRRHSEPMRTAISREMLLKSCKLVSPEIVKTLTDMHYQDHPWFRGTERVPGGMIRRLGMLAVMPSIYNAAPLAAEPAAEAVSPLYSQPVVELLLRIPIHVHFEAGRDRGLARRAFSQEVPQPILQRHWKDRAPGFHDELIHRNLDFLREFFLDGVLAREGLLDRAAIENALSTAPNKSDVFPGEIINHMGTEIWARHWT